MSLHSDLTSCPSDRQLSVFLSLSMVPNESSICSPLQTTLLSVVCVCVVAELGYYVEDFGQIVFPRVLLFNLRIHSGVSLL